MHVSPLPDKISTKFQRLCLCFWGLASHWDSWDNYVAEPEVKTSKIEAQFDQSFPFTWRQTTFWCHAVRGGLIRLINSVLILIHAADGNSLPPTYHLNVTKHVICQRKIRKKSEILENVDIHISRKKTFFKIKISYFINNLKKNLRKRLRGHQWTPPILSQLPD